MLYAFKLSRRDSDVWLGLDRITTNVTTNVTIVALFYHIIHPAPLNLACIAHYVDVEECCAYIYVIRYIISVSSFVLIIV